MVRVDDRVHGTTHEVPRVRFAAEQRALLPLPSSSLRVRQRRLSRRVSNDAFVDVDTVRYSVPHALVGPMSRFDVGETRVRVYDGPQLVAERARSKEPHALVVDKAHHAALWRSPATRLSSSTALAATGRSLADYAAVIGGAP